MRINDSAPRPKRRGESPAAWQAARGQQVVRLSPTDTPLRGGHLYDTSMTDFAMQAGLILSHNGASLADVFVASGTLMPPCLIYLADRHDDATHSRLRAMLAAEQMRRGGLAGLLGNELAFQRAVVDALGSETLLVLTDTLHEIIGRAMSRLDQRPAPVRNLVEVKSHHEIIRLVETGRGQAAAALVRVRTEEIERIIREYDATGGLLSRFLFG
jgi:DNA-binding FadR family transcriptional regulator